MNTEDEVLLAIVKKLEKEMQCNCDLDAWEPERDTHHSWVCRIHRTAKGKLEELLRSKESK